MDAGSQKRVSSGALLFAVLAVCFSIGATVLLANDKKHLKSLLTYLNLAPATRFAEPPPKMKHAKRQKLAARTVYLPPHLLKFERAGDRPSFARDFVVSGKDLCDRFTAAGFSNPKGWQASPVSIRNFECMADLAAVKAEDPAQRASLFIDIRGEASGDIRSIRIKAVAPETPDGAAILTKLEKTLTLVIAQTHWTDLASMLEPARRMQAYQAQHFGISVSIKPEPTAPHRLNVILLASEEPPGVKLTRAFFDRDRWLRPAALSDRPIPHPSVTKSHVP